MRTRLYNACILTMEQGLDIFNGEIWVEDGRISRMLSYEEENAGAVYGTENPNEQGWDECIDCEGNLLMPGFKNAHTHSAMSFLRSYADDMPLQQWLYDKIFPMEAKLREDDIYHLTKLSVLEYLTSGITAVFDMYLKPEQTAKACKEMGMRCVLVSGLNDFTSSIEQTEAEFIKYNQEEDLISYCLGFHAEYTCSEALLKEVAALADKYKAPVYMHLSETQHEVEECIRKYGKTPVGFLDSLGIFNYGGGGYHCVHLTSEDMEILKKRGVYVVTNPASNMKLASGTAPIAQYLSEGIPVAIGTDGPASNNCLDMFREMFLVTGLAKLKEMDPSAVKAETVLRMATVTGAYAMGLKDCDVLAEGKYADIIMIDLKQPNMQPLHNIPANIVYSGSKSNVKMTMINGNILYYNGKFNIYENIDDIYEKCGKILNVMNTRTE